jgi:proteasome lid subunit RPN8/RPN11
VGQRRGRVWLAQRICPVQGEVSQVQFDGPQTLAREEARGEVIGFLHTHPSGPGALSQRDVRTMRSWCSAFGKPLLCLIDAAGELYGWRFDGHDSKGVPLAAIERFSRGRVVAVDE